MVNSQELPNRHVTTGEILQFLLADVKSKVSRTYGQYERVAVESPGKAILVALAIGYCMHRLPLRSLLILQARTAVALAPAALLGLGAAKLYGLFERPGRSGRPIPAKLRHWA